MSLFGGKSLLLLKKMKKITVRIYFSSAAQDVMLTVQNQLHQHGGSIRPP